MGNLLSFLDSPKKKKKKGKKKKSKAGKHDKKTAKKGKNTATKTKNNAASLNGANNRAASAQKQIPKGKVSSNIKKFDTGKPAARKPSAAKPAAAKPTKNKPGGSPQRKQLGVTKSKKGNFFKPTDASESSEKEKDDQISQLPRPSMPRKRSSIVRAKQRKSLKRASSRNVTGGSFSFARSQTPDIFADADLSKFVVTEHKYGGQVSFEKVGKLEEKKGSILRARKQLEEHPKEYTALQFQTSMLEWPPAEQKYTLVHREGTFCYRPTAVSNKGWMTMLLNDYHALPPFKNNKLPKKDKYTDTILSKYKGFKLPEPIVPGRGMGLVDSPNIKIFGEVDPSDVIQGLVGDCWLLSGISSLAEFDGAIRKLFRKTKNIHKMPHAEVNFYTVTLWDLKTWKEVDIVVDERLSPHPTLPGQLLSNKPSVDGELWVCYLEKALAVHCGGWDKMTGGTCTHAWSILTGNKKQYTLRKQASGKYTCNSRVDTSTGKLAKTTNSPHDCNLGTFPSPWPKAGGGGFGELDEEEVFARLCTWDDLDFCMGAARSGNAKQVGHHASTAVKGMVDNHSYSVVECLDDVAGTDIDLIKVRNPWGFGEMEKGEFIDDGPGWKKYPQIKAQLKHVAANDGLFWMTKKEFFNFFDLIFVSAQSMSEFIDK